MDAKVVLARLEAIRKADPVADLVKDLLDAGVTEEQLHGMLQGRMNDPWRWNFTTSTATFKRSGWTFNHCGVRVRR